MSKVLMSEELVGRIDEDLLFGSTDVEPTNSALFELEMEHGCLTGTLIHGEWDTAGCLCKIILKLDARDIQKVLEGIRVCSVNFRPSKSEKNVGVNLGNVHGISHTIDVIEEQTLITVTIHPIVDT
jgi:hypothetical protein